MNLVVKSISIVIVSWNTRELTLSCLASLSKATLGSNRIDVEVVVVDNSSSDDSAEAIKEYFPEVILIESGSNLGFGRANNIALGKVTGEIIFFLNSDTLVSSNTLEVLLEAFEADRSIGAIGCKLVESDGSIQKSVRGHPSFTAFLYSDTLLHVLFFLKSEYERYRQKNFDFTREQLVDTVMGAAMAVPKKIFDQLGGFDPVYFMYFEEADLCRRIGDAGYIVKYPPTTKVQHIGGASSSQARSRMYLVYRQSMFSYFRKHEGLLKTGVFSLLFKPLFIMQTIASASRDGTKYFIAIIGANRGPRADKYRQRYRAKLSFLTRDIFSFIFS